MKAKFYEFAQNNSGGYFDVNEKVCHRVVIEALSEQQAISIFEPMIRDQSPSCSCCGDRWSLSFNPVITNKEIKKSGADSIESYYQIKADEFGWTNPDVRIYFLSGKVKEIYTKRSVQ